MAHAQRRSGVALEGEEVALTRFTVADMFLGRSVRGRLIGAFLMMLSVTLGFWGVATFVPTSVGTVATKAGLSAPYYSAVAGLFLCIQRNSSRLQVKRPGRAARAIVDGVAESFDTLEAVASAQIDGPERWAVAIHFRDPPNEAAVRALVGLAAGTEAANALAFSAVETKDWVKASLEGLAPVEAGRFFVHGAHHRARVPINRIAIEIEAALAFGTGHHGTTRGCLAALDRILKRRRPRRILDVGCGTGVLAIAAALATRRPVAAGDIDPVSVQVARDNARLNRAGVLVEIFRASGLGDRRATEIATRARAVFDYELLAKVLAQRVRDGARRVAASG